MFIFICFLNCVEGRQRNEKENERRDGRLEMLIKFGKVENSRINGIDLVEL